MYLANALRTQHEHVCQQDHRTKAAPVSSGASCQSCTSSNLGSNSIAMLDSRLSREHILHMSTLGFFTGVASEGEPYMASVERTSPGHCRVIDVDDEGGYWIVSHGHYQYNTD